MGKNVFAAILLISVITLAACTPPALPATPALTSTPAQTAIPALTLAPSATATLHPTLPPTPLPPIPESIVAGDYHTCRLHSDGMVSCFGWNAFSQAGAENPENLDEANIPLLYGITAISAGSYHTCALNWLGEVLCWGRNNTGQLGDGSLQTSAKPVRVIGLENKIITQISAGSLHTCALDSSGAVWCWGSNRQGKLGSSAAGFESSTALQVAGLPTVSQVAAGGNHTCALEANGTVWCWGDGTFGQIGLKLFASSTVPVKVDTVPGKVTSISTGWFHTCGLIDSGQVYCWGKNTRGQLGNSSTKSRADAVQSVGLNSTMSQVAVGGEMTCAISLEGALYCWGDNAYGQLNSTNTNDMLFPTLIPTTEQVDGLTIGGSHICITTIQGTIECMGANDHGQLGSYLQ